MNQNTNTAIDQMNALQAKQAELKAARKELKAAQARKEWEAETKARNPAYVIGSLRKGTAEDEANLGHCHGWVCTIECSCGKQRTVNKQDAKQCLFCDACKVEARKARAKAKRMEKALEGASVEDLQAKLEATQAELDALNG
jgi:hypothetical protein